MTLDSPIVAAFDLGSNSLKWLIGDGERLLGEGKAITRIGEGVEHAGSLSEVAVQRTKRVLRQAVDEARRLGATQLAGVATAGLRGASDGDAFVEQVAEELGLRLEIIDGRREAELAYAMPAASYADGPCVVVDFGGRSTEVIVGDGPAIHELVSLPLGGVRLTERFVTGDPIPAEQIDQLSAHIADVLAGAPEAAPGTSVIGVSGSVVTLKGLAFGLDDEAQAVSRAEGATLTRGEVEQELARLRLSTVKQRLLGTLVPSGRADVIVAASMVVLGVMERYGANSMRVSSLGVRYGLLREMVSEELASTTTSR